MNEREITPQLLGRDPATGKYFNADDKPSRFRLFWWRLLGIDRLFARLLEQRLLLDEHTLMMDRVYKVAGDAEAITLNVGPQLNYVVEVVSDLDARLVRYESEIPAMKRIKVQHDRERPGPLPMKPAPARYTRDGVRSG